MPHRALVTNELAEMFGVLSHPVRLRIVLELREGERDVNHLHKLLGVSHSGVSQHLSALRLHRLVSERREGRHVFYSLRNHELPRWLLEGMQFLDGAREAQQLHSAIESVQAEWAAREAP